MISWLNQMANGSVRPNSDISQYAKGTLTMAPRDPHPVTSIIIARAISTQADRGAGPPPGYRIPDHNGVPLVPWLDRVIKAQEETRKLRFTVVPEYIKHDTNSENYLKYADAVNKHLKMNEMSSNTAIVNSQTLGLGNNRART